MRSAMPPTVPDSSAVSHPVLPDIGPLRRAKANVRKPDVDWQVEIGRALQRAIKRTGLTNQEAAAKAKVDDAEFGKWMNGTRRPQLDRLFAVEEFHQPVVIELAKLASGLEVIEEIRVRRSA